MEDLRPTALHVAAGREAIDALTLSRLVLRALAAALGGCGLFFLWATWGGDNAAVALTAVITLALAAGITIGTP